MVLKGEDRNMAPIRQTDQTDHPEQRVLMDMPMPPFSRIRKDQPQARYIP
jgi:hypothetical protein